MAGPREGGCADVDWGLQEVVADLKVELLDFQADSNLSPQITEDRKQIGSNVAEGKKTARSIHRP